MTNPFLASIANFNNSIPAEHLTKVCTLNLWHSPAEVTRRLAQAHHLLAAVGADVICLQEVRFPASGAPSTAQALAAQLGMSVVSEQEFDTLENGDMSGSAILSNLTSHESDSSRLPGEGGARGCGVVHSWLQSTTGRPLLVANAHLAWGMREEAARVAQVQAVDSLVSRELSDHKHGWAAPEAAGEPVVVFAGSFNSSSTHDCVRWLTGRAVVNGTSADWTDAWEVPQTGQGDLKDDGATIAPQNPWFNYSAQLAGIAPFPVPRRRVDFIFVKGWARGVPGHPVHSSVIGDDMEVPPSDHYGVVASLWTPPFTG